MLPLTLSQMRRSLGRLIAAGVAIALGTGFVAATFMGTAVFTDTTRANIVASYGDADLVRTSTNADYFVSLTEEDLHAIADLPEVAGVHNRDGVYLSVGTAEATRGMMAWPTPTNPELYPDALLDGRLPEARGEIAIPEPVSKYLDISVGDTLIAYGESRLDPESGEMVPEQADMTIVGVTAQPDTFMSSFNEMGVIYPDDIDLVYGPDSGNTHYYGGDVTFLLADGISVEQGRAAITGAVEPNFTLETPDEAADRFVDEFLPAQVALTTVVLIFAIIALAVAAMVIANTFQVLVAQRARTLAMLRCVGASSRQVKRSVRQEAMILGAVAATVGVFGAWGLLQVVLTIARNMQPDILLPDMVTLNWLTVLVPIAAGTLMAYFASRGAGTAATQVPALAALRPLDPPTLSDKRGKARLGFSLLLLTGGALGVVVALVDGNNRAIDTTTAFVGVVGCIALFTAVLISVPLWLPKTLSTLGRPVRKTGPMSRLAIANTRRNPRRTSATTAALLIGVTLVATVAAGAEVAKATVNGTLDDSYPYDLEINYPRHNYSQVTAVLDANEHVIDHTRLMHTDRLVVTTVDGLDVMNGKDSLGEIGYTELFSRIVDSADLKTVLRSTADIPVEPGTIVLPWPLFSDAGQYPHRADPVISPGDEVRVYVWPEPDWETINWDDEEQVNTWMFHPDLDELDYITVKAIPSSRGDGRPDLVNGYYDSTMIDAVDASELTSNTVGVGGSGDYYDSLWVKVDDIDNARALLEAINDDLGDLGAYAWGPVEERASIEMVIDIAVKVVYALLAIAVLIAIVGVTNTLSLSVIERRRESATMRTIGLKQRQLRRSLAIEGVFISLAGATLGVVVGTMFGWLGVRMLVGPDTVFALPTLTLTIVLVGAVLAGLLASWVPARMAAKTTPVEALATE